MSFNTDLSFGVKNFTRTITATDTMCRRAAADYLL